MSDDEGGLPPFAKKVLWGGVALASAVVLIGYVIVPTVANITCHTNGVGCGVSTGIFSTIKSDHPYVAPQPDFRPVIGPAATLRPPFAASGNTWVNQGPNAVCQGRRKGTKFTCLSPSSGRMVDCFCGD